MMKNWIRWQGLVAFLGVAIIFAVFWLLFVDGFVERMVERYGTRALGAKVELEEADLSLFPAGLMLSRLQVTNPDEPMKNAVEIAQVNFSLSTLNLLRRKIIIEEMTLDGIRLNTPRKTSGAVISRPAAAPEVPKKAPKKGPCGEIELPSFDIPDVKNILEKEGLESVKLFESLQTDVQSEKEKWSKRLLELPDKEKFDEYRRRINRLQSKTKAPFALLSRAGEITAIQKDIRRDLEALKSARHDFNRMTNSLKMQLDQAKEAPLKDVERLKKKYSISPKGLANMSQLLLGVKICSWAQKALTWYEKLKPVLERAKKERKGHEVVEPMRGGGVNVRFKEYTPLPDFLIRRAKALIHLQAGDLAGKIENITPNQGVLGIPLTFEFSGEEMKGIHAVKIDGSLDHIVPSRSKDWVDLRLNGYEVRSIALIDKEWPVTLKNASADFYLRTLFSGDKISANLVADLKSVNLSTEVQKGVSPLVQAIVSALSDVSEFTVRAAVEGTMADYDIQITSDLDRVLKSAAGKVVESRTAKLEKELKKAVFAQVNGPLDQSKGSLSGLNAIDNELTSRLNMGSGLLGGLKLPF